MAEAVATMGPDTEVDYNPLCGNQNALPCVYICMQEFLGTAKRVQERFLSEGASPPLPPPPPPPPPPSPYNIPLPSSFSSPPTITISF